MRLGLTIKIVLLTIAVLTLQFSVAQKRSKRKAKKPVEETSASAEKLFTEGTKYYILEDFAKAYVLYQKALEVEPNNAAIHYKIGELLAKGDDKSKALLHATQAIKLSPKNKFYYLLAIKIYSAQSNLKNVARLYEEMITTIPGTTEYLFDLAAVYIFQKDWDSAIKTYDRAKDEYGTLEEIVHQKQQIYLKQNKLDLAVAEGEELIKKNPNNDEYVIRLADILKNNNRMSEAKRKLNRLLEKSPSNARAQLMLYEIYNEEGDVEKADQRLIAAFASSEIDINAKLQIMVGYIKRLPSDDLLPFVISLADNMLLAHPRNPNAYAIYGDVYFKLGEKQNAINKYLQTIAIDKSNFGVWQNIIQLEADLLSTDSVIVHTSEALEFFPNQAILYYYNGFANLNKKNHQEAIDAFEQGKKLASTNRALTNIMNIQLGDAYNAKQDYQKSDASYEEVLKFDADNDHVLNNYSYFLSLRSEKLDLAKKMSTKLVKRNPNNPTFLDTHAWVLYVNEEYKEALIFMERTMDNSKNPSGTLHEHYGDILFKVGRVDEAVEQWKKAKGMNVTSELINKKIANRRLYE